MPDLSDLKRDPILDVLMVGASVTKTAKFLDLARSIVSKVMTEFEKEKISSLRQNLKKGKAICYQKQFYFKQSCFHKYSV